MPCSAVIGLRFASTAVVGATVAPALGVTAEATSDDVRGVNASVGEQATPTVAAMPTATTMRGRACRTRARKRSNGTCIARAVSGTIFTISGIIPATARAIRSARKSRQGGQA